MDQFTEYDWQLLEQDLYSSLGIANLPPEMGEEWIQHDCGQHSQETQQIAENFVGALVTTSSSPTACPHESDRVNQPNSLKCSDGRISKRKASENSHDQSHKARRITVPRKLASRAARHRISTAMSSLPFWSSLRFVSELVDQIPRLKQASPSARFFSDSLMNENDLAKVLTERTPDAYLLDRFLPRSEFTLDHSVAPSTALQQKLFNSVDFKYLVYALTNNPSESGSPFSSRGMFSFLEPKLKTLIHASASTDGRLNGKLEIAKQRFAAEVLFMCAIVAGDNKAVEAILSDQKVGIDVNEPLRIHTLGQDECTPVELSAYLQSIAVTKTLIEHGADVNKSVGKFYCRNGGALAAALSGGFIRYKSLQETMTELEADDKYGTGLLGLQSRLEAASRDGLHSRQSEELLSIVLVAGAPVEVIVLKRLLRQDAIKVFQYLLTAGTTLHHKEWMDHGVFHLATEVLNESELKTIFNLLDASRIDLNCRAIRNYDDGYDDGDDDDDDSYHEKFYVETAWDLPTWGHEHIIDIAVSRGQERIVRQLRTCGVRFTINTLTAAIKRDNNKEMIDLVLAEDVKIDVFSSYYRSTPYAAAIASKDSDLIHLLEQRGGANNLQEEYPLCAALAAAAKAGNELLLRSLLESRTKLNPCIMGFALTVAVGYDETGTSLLLLEAGAATDSSQCMSVFGYSAVTEDDLSEVHKGYKYAHPLVVALENENPILVQALIEHEADVTIPVKSQDPDTMGESMSPLRYAMLWGDESIIRKLLFAGAADKEDPDGLIGFAIEQEIPAVLQLLFEYGQDVGRTLSHRSSLEWAVKSGNTDMVKQLLRRGSEPADTGALSEAIERNHRLILDLLLRAYLIRYPLGKPGFGDDVLNTAIIWRDGDLFQYLLAHKIGISSHALKHHPIFTAISRPGEDGFKITKLVIEAGVNPDNVASGFHYRETPLLFAIKENRLDVVELLLSRGADCNLPASGCLKRTPLQQAVEYGFVPIIQLLLDYGAKVNAPPASRSGATTLQLAAIKGYLLIAEELLERGADVMAPAAKVHGRTALAGAAEHGQRDMVNFLLNLGDYSVADHQDALKYARLHDRVLVIQQLELALADREAQRYVCHICQKIFSRAYSLKRHEDAHGEAKATCQCDICSKTFKREDHLKRHKETVHQKSSLQCPNCDKSISRQDYLAEHAERCKGKVKGFGVFRV